MAAETRPLIAITMGDPGGVGPEVTARALARADVHLACRVVVLGDLGVMREAARSTGAPVEFERADAPGGAMPARTFGVIGSHLSPAGRFAVGRVDPANGAAAYASICGACEMARLGKVDAIVTAPIAKEAMFAAGYQFPGHTELLADLCERRQVRMMLEGGGLRVVLETIHVALSEVPALVTVESLSRTLAIAQGWAARFLSPSAEVGVCGLNPHAGEAGHFGNEEREIIAPTIAEARARGMRVSGPYPADTVFHRALKGDFDLVVAMYHDQGLIPIKTLDFHGGVNITLGLPIIRTSPDHGTAFDIARRGTADESSMVAAILRAADLARRKAALGANSTITGG